MIRHKDFGWLEHEGRLMRLRDQRARLRQAREEGWAEGGAEALAEAKRIGRIRILQRLLELPVSRDEDLAHFTVSQQEAMADELNRSVESRLSGSSP